MANDVRPAQPSETPAPPRDGIVSSGWLANSSVFGDTRDEHRMKRALGASITTVAVYSVLFVLLLVAARTATQVMADPPEPLKYVMTFVQEPGPGGGGGGSPQPAAAKPIEIPKVKPPDPVPVVAPPPTVPPPPIPTLTAPVITTNAQVIQAPGSSSVSLSPYGGGGRGGGIGSGRGDGVGPGVGGGFGDGFYKPGSGVTWPTVLRQVKPTYTPEAMRLKIQGEVTLEVEILANGTVGDVRVKRSLDRVHGLDQEAIRVAKLWLFKAAMDKEGKSVPVVGELIISFNLH